VLGNLAIILQDQGHLDAAKAKFAESLALLRQTGDRPGVARTLGNLGELLLRQGNLPAAKVSFLAQLDVGREIGDMKQRAYALYGLGEALKAEGDLNGARAKHQESLSLRTNLNEQGLAAESRLALAELSLEEGDAIHATEEITSALEELRREKELEQVVRANALLARAILAKGRMEDALALTSSVNQHAPNIKDVSVRC
jgi:tetratricopeptide (TPR) repeat protein